MPNTAYVTCKQTPMLGASIYDITVATQYGGSFSLVSDITGAPAAVLGGTNYFDVYFQNNFGKLIILEN